MGRPCDPVCVPGLYSYRADVCMADLGDVICFADREIGTEKTREE